MDISTETYTHTRPNCKLTVASVVCPGVEDLDNLQTPSNTHKTDTHRHTHTDTSKLVTFVDTVVQVKLSGVG